ncbi:YeiH family protein [Lysinibacillus irui]|uniref:YeiH family protein n=1 Tax=Lysinibacillus irui TaxID=2998077 RepID=A0AAJ5RK72_9BACI|nr:YeiH family protein [Lysinibacillus irui]MEA0555770.1 YeiH family protein [Lysinibacillus irui]MEA0977226.1 YeiH family protein [Lysinibacillus irui]MEA1043380.1 YeiH family protein [Lysinibacillus irui]WDV06848.1 YeiH family protein [Lysinibacillus irui]
MVIRQNKEKSTLTPNFLKGILLTLLIALVAKYIATFPFFSILGQLVIAIIVGMAWRAAFKVQDTWQVGIAFSSKKLLRLGIILLGMRLNLADIYHAGASVFLIAVINLLFALMVVYGLTKMLKVDQKLGILTACGTAICGAAAVVAIAPQIKANQKETAVGAAIVALLGTVFTLIYTVLYSILDLTPTEYGIFAGGTLHEIAHVIAAASAGGNEAIDIAVIVKLTRVALLVPVAIIIGIFYRKMDKSEEKKGFTLSIIPWFILGFLAMSAINSLGIIPANVAQAFVNIAYILIAMAMAGLGLNVEIKTFKELGVKAFIAGLVGSVCLSILGYILVIFLT